MSARLAVDIGGTFTDVVLERDDKAHAIKVLTTPDALAYMFPWQITSGWNSGNLNTVAGGAGWRLSMKELLSVMNHVRRKGEIVMATKAQYMLDHYFGIDMMTPTAAGKLYNKNGAWGTGDYVVAFHLRRSAGEKGHVDGSIGRVP